MSSWQSKYGKISQKPLKNGQKPRKIQFLTKFSVKLMCISWQNVHTYFAITRVTMKCQNVTFDMTLILHIVLAHFGIKSPNMVIFTSKSVLISNAVSRVYFVKMAKYGSKSPKFTIFTFLKSVFFVYTTPGKVCHAFHVLPG